MRSVPFMPDEPEEVRFACRSCFYVHFGKVLTSGGGVMVHFMSTVHGRRKPRTLGPGECSGDRLFPG
jgi:hypothetical protein